MEVISPFDPWKDPLCTCPPKYSLNPYTGCAHACVYCYISSYIPRAFECRQKKDLLKKVEKDVKKIEDRPVAMSNSSDPYPPLEKEYELTRNVLKILQHHQRPVIITTKSDLVARDSDILGNMKAAVMFTVTTMQPLHKVIEPGAPSPEKRIGAIKKLAEKGIPVGVRLDPVIPGLNNDFESVIKSAALAGASHVVASTYKLRSDGWKRLKSAFPEVADKIAPLYFEKGEVHHSSRYLPEKIRREILKRIKDEAESRGLTFAVCREGLFNTKVSCDGSHLIKEVSIPVLRCQKNQRAGRFFD